jgi:hypothetical protein
MGETFPTADVAVLLCLALVGFAGAYFLFLRRDITR